MERQQNCTNVSLKKHFLIEINLLFLFVVVMPRTILPQRNRRWALSATGTRKPEEEKDARGVTYFMKENVISTHEVARFNEHIRNLV